MTARPAALPQVFLDDVRAPILALPGVSGLVADLTTKPPGTLEWESRCRARARNLPGVLADRGVEGGDAFLRAASRVDVRLPRRDYVRDHHRDLLGALRGGQRARVGAAVACVHSEVRSDHARRDDRELNVWMRLLHFLAEHLRQGVHE